MRSPELVISTEPTPVEVQYLEDRLYEFNSAATGITDGAWLAIFVRDDDHRIVAGICGNTWAVTRRFASSGWKRRVASRDWGRGCFGRQNKRRAGVAAGKCFS